MCTPLVSQTLVIKNPQGLHARPAELLARTACRFEAQVELVRSSQRVDAKSILHILTLGADEGTELLLEARGVDAQQAVETLARLFENNFVDDGTLRQEPAG
jgi:phosphotransferase system HPr (HPr) family protein